MIDINELCAEAVLLDIENINPEAAWDAFDAAGYALGVCEPNYPVPATLMNADAATIWYWIGGHCPEKNGPCRCCIDEYMDALEFHKFFCKEV